MQDVISWPALWQRALITETPTMPMYFFAYFIRKYIAIVESNPPEKLIAAAVAPLVIKANPLFTAVIIRA